MIVGPLGSGTLGQVMQYVYQRMNGAPDNRSPLAPGEKLDNFVVVSGNQTILGEIDIAGDLTLTIYSTVADPMVEAKQHKRKRRYIIANAPPLIQ